MTTALFAFFGADLASASPSVLARLRADGAELLPLDDAAIQACVQTDLPFSLIDEWIDWPATDPEGASRTWSRSWFAGVEAELTASGVCWADADSHAMHWLWRDVKVGLALADAVQARGVERFLHVRPGSPPISNYYDPPPAPALHMLWSALLPSSTQAFPVAPTPTTGDAQRSLLRRIRDKGTRARARAGRLVQRLDRLRGTHTGKAVLVCNAHEAPRFSALVRGAQSSSPGGLIGVTNPEGAAEIAERWGVPVLHNPPIPALDERLPARFLAACDRAAALRAGTPVGRALGPLRYLFEHASRHRWPALEAAFRGWLDLWRALRPRAVLVSTLPDSESQLPATAARQLGIPTLAVPHGGNVLPGWPIATDVELCAFQGNVRQRLDQGVAPERVIGCRDLVAANEYPVREQPPEATSTRPTVLALTGPCRFPGCAAPYFSPSAHRRALEALVLPERLDAELILRPHPHWSDPGLVASASPSLLAAASPPDVSLHHLLDRTNAVVAVNYWGTALVHALRRGLPVVFLCTDPRLFKSSPPLPLFRMREGGAWATTREELWEHLARLLEDPAYREELSQRARTLAQTLLGEEGFVDLPTAIDQAVAAFG